MSALDRLEGSYGASSKKLRKILGSRSVAGVKRYPFAHRTGRITDSRLSCESALKGSRREYRARRQTAQAAHDLKAEGGTSEWAAEGRDGLVLGFVCSSRLLYGARSGSNEETHNSEKCDDVEDPNKPRKSTEAV